MWEIRIGDTFDSYITRIFEHFFRSHPSNIPNYGNDMVAFVLYTNHIDATYNHNMTLSKVFDVGMRLRHILDDVPFGPLVRLDDEDIQEILGPQTYLTMINYIDILLQDPRVQNVMARPNGTLFFGDRVEDVQNLESEDRLMRIWETYKAVVRSQQDANAPENGEEEESDPGGSGDERDQGDRLSYDPCCVPRFREFMPPGAFERLKVYPRTAFHELPDIPRLYRELYMECVDRMKLALRMALRHAHANHDAAITRVANLLYAASTQNHLPHFTRHMRGALGMPREATVLDLWHSYAYDLPPQTAPPAATPCRPIDEARARLFPPLCEWIESNV